MGNWFDEVLEAAAEGLKIHLTRKFAAEVEQKSGRPPGQCVMLIIDEAQAVSMPRTYLESKGQLKEHFGKTGKVRMYRDEQYCRFVYLWSEE